MYRRLLIVLLMEIALNKVKYERYCLSKYTKLPDLCIKLVY